MVTNMKSCKKFNEKAPTPIGWNKERTNGQGDSSALKSLKFPVGRL